MSEINLKILKPGLRVLALMAGIAGIYSCTKDRPPFSTFQDCDSCPELVVIPAGEFYMGSTLEERIDEIRLDESRGLDLQDIRGHYLPELNRDEEPKQKIRIDYPFAIGKYVLTKGQFEAYLTETNQDNAGCIVVKDGKLAFDEASSWQNPYFETSDHHPAVCISWLEVQDYLSWLSTKTGATYRLPSEAEWEYVARSGTTTTRFFGNNRDSICDYGNVFDLTIYEHRQQVGIDVSKRVPFNCYDGYTDIAPVNRPELKPNPWGVYEMHGNVFEMVQDRFHMDRNGAPLDGSAWEDGDLPYRIGKGGGYSTIPAFTRPGYKGDLTEDFKLFYLGFRVVREL